MKAIITGLIIIMIISCRPALEIDIDDPFPCDSPESFCEGDPECLKSLEAVCQGNGLTFKGSKLNLRGWKTKN